MTNNRATLLALCLICTLTHSQYVEEEEGRAFRARPGETLNLYKILADQADINNTFFYPDPNLGLDETFDFVIVGAGSAGSVLANRLSEVRRWRILLLEAGDEATPYTDIPALAPLFQFTDLNWNYLMEKQDNVALGLEDQKMAWPRGKGIGGSSLINYMIHVRGNKIDYNRWAKQGNPGWSYKDIFKYFVKSEDATLEKSDAGYHAKGGYLGVMDIPYRSESAHAFVRAAQEAGHKYVDYNGKDQMGVSYVQGTLREGKRCSAEKAFLRPIRDRTNLVVSPRSRVVKLLIDPNTKEANGVQYFKDGKLHVARASKEVVLSAGAFSSPQLLMLSGIGPRQHLQDHGIPVLEDLQVGRKMYDHITFIGLSFTVNESIVALQKDVEKASSLLEIVEGRGPLTNLGGVEALTYIKTKESKDPKNYPDIELIFIGGAMSTDFGEIYRKTFRITDEIYDAIWKPLEKRAVWQVLPMLMHPKSFGFLELNSTDPFDAPKFHGKYFTDPENHDIKTFIAAIREVQRIASMPSMRRYDAQIVSTPVPGCQSFTFDSDAYWECALRHISPTLHHQVTTCKMGPRRDPEAVVDHRLRVHGMKRLRVADTSVIPFPITAHTNVPAMMIGDKLADMLKEEWGKDVEDNEIDFRHMGHVI